MLEPTYSEFGCTQTLLAKSRKKPLGNAVGKTSDTNIFSITFWDSTCFLSGII